MSALVELVLGLAVIILVALALTGKGRVLLRGFANLFYEDIAKTPEGADAIYSQAIEKLTKEYNTALDNYRKLEGIKLTSEKNLKDAEANIKQIDATCQNLVKNGEYQKAELYAAKLEETRDDYNIFLAEVKQYTPMCEQAQKVFQQKEKELEQAKKDRKLVVRKLKLDQQTKEVYDSIDKIATNNPTDKLLDAVKQGALAKEELANGARVVHENKLSTKIQDIEAESKNVRASNYVEELKKKYQQK